MSQDQEQKQNQNQKPESASGSESKPKPKGRPKAAPTKCTVLYCPNMAEIKGMCKPHYFRHYNGRPAYSQEEIIAAGLLPGASSILAPEQILTTRRNHGPNTGRSKPATTLPSEASAVPPIMQGIPPDGEDDLAPPSSSLRARPSARPTETETEIEDPNEVPIDQLGPDDGIFRDQLPDWAKPSDKDELPPGFTADPEQFDSEMIANHPDDGPDATPSTEDVRFTVSPPPVLSDDWSLEKELGLRPGEEVDPLWSADD